MEIRPARAADAEALAVVFADWDHALEADAIVERLREWEGTPLASVLVAEVGEEVAGVAAVAASPHLARPGRFARLIGLAVRATHRRRGVAAALLGAVEDQARAWGCDRLELTSSRWRAEAPAFYEAMGYADRSPEQARYVREL
jgi:GNAT superfamily N-acetyltransferase